MQYARYLRETQGKEVYETEHGFLTYGFNCVPGVDFPHVYIEDIWVAPEHREKRVAAKMADHVCRLAKAAGISVCLGSVNTKSKTPDRSLRVLQGYGMKIYGAGIDAVWMIKEI